MTFFLFVFHWNRFLLFFLINLHLSLILILSFHSILLPPHFLIISCLILLLIIICSLLPQYTPFKVPFIQSMWCVLWFSALCPIFSSLQFMLRLALGNHLHLRSIFSSYSCLLLIIKHFIHDRSIIYEPSYQNMCKYTQHLVKSTCRHWDVLLKHIEGNRLLSILFPNHL